MIKASSEGITLTVRLTPNAGREGVEGSLVHGSGQSMLKVAVKSPPEKGAANRDACRVVAKFLGVPQKRVCLLHGGKNRNKTLLITNISAETAARKIEEAFPPA